MPKPRSRTGAHAELALITVRQQRRLIHHRTQLIRLAIEALSFYADPASYHALMFYADPPAGGFAEDFDYVMRYGRKMPGAKARTALLKMQKLVDTRLRLLARTRGRKQRKAKLCQVRH